MYAPTSTIQRLLRPFRRGIGITLRRGMRSQFGMKLGEIVAFERDAALTTNALIKLFPSGQASVLHGPFRGLQYPQLYAVCSALLPKLVGCYEAELHPIIDDIGRQNYEVVVDIGCAEGYYAVGLARYLPNTMVYSFDTNPLALKLCEGMATANGVRDRIHLAALCDTARLTGIPCKGRGLIVCDCEGFELDLFPPALPAQLGNFDLLIETHDFITPGITACLASRFAKTHTIHTIVSGQLRRIEDYPELARLTLAERHVATAENRPCTMHWIWLTTHIRKSLQDITT